MKQETIDLIKSMTEQGFLVIVDPEKLKGEDRAIIKVMEWKDTDNKAEATLTAEDPEIDLLQCDGRRFRAKIRSILCEGIISVEGSAVFLCQNSMNGNEAKDRKGFNWSWSVGNGTRDCLIEDDVTDFELLPEPRVIFTNCVGEVFTEDDAEKDIKVWHFQSDTNKIYSTMLSDIESPEYYTASKRSTDIFRSKKSLLKYLYETCE